MRNNLTYKFYQTTNEWCTEDFISNSIIKHLKANGYKIHKEDGSKIFDKKETIIIASKFFTKEIIEVKGLADESDRSRLLKKTAKNISNRNSFRDTFSEILLNSFINFGRYYSEQGSVMAMGLPNVERCRAIIERVEDYFAANDLSLKLYLVNEDGSVEVSNLNETGLQKPAP